MRPNKRNDDLIARYTESKGHSEYYENCYVYTIFKNRKSTYKGYVYLDVDYRYWQGIEFEKHMRPAIITDDGTHITLEVRHQSQITELYSLLDNNPKDMFPLEFEIQANLKGFPERGQLPGFIYGKEFIK